MWVIFLQSLLFSNVLSSSVYLSHKIHHKSKSTQNHPSNDLTKSQEIVNSIESYEYPGDYSAENSFHNLKQSSSEHKVQNLLLKDMGLQKMPNMKTVNILIRNSDFIKSMIITTCLRY